VSIFGELFSPTTLDALSPKFSPEAIMIARSICALADEYRANRLMNEANQAATNKQMAAVVENAKALIDKPAPAIPTSAIQSAAQFLAGYLNQIGGNGLICECETADVVIIADSAIKEKVRALVDAAARGAPVQ